MSTLSISCGKDDIKPPVKGKVSWTIDDIRYTADAMTYAELRPRDPSYPPLTSVRAASYEKSVLHITLYKMEVPGTFMAGQAYGGLNSVFASRGDFYFSAESDVDASSATIAVTGLSDDNIKGNFEGTLVSDSGESVTVSGSFDVPLEK